MLTFEPFYSSSAGNLYRLRSSRGGSLLLEAGVSIGKIKRALGYRLNEISGMLVTHAHADHAVSARAVMRCGIPGHMSHGTAHGLGLVGHPMLQLISAGSQSAISPFTVLPFSVNHDADEPLGFLISDGEDKICFAMDTYFIGPRFRGLTHIAVECNWSSQTISPNLAPAVRRRLYSSHMSLETVQGFMRAQDLRDVREIWLLHLSDDNSNEDFFRREIMRSTGRPVFVAPKGPEYAGL